jgi:hypothetical protein
MNDGTKAKRNSPDVHFFLESDDSADRFAKELSHTIALCGGRSATF